MGKPSVGTPYAKYAKAIKPFVSFNTADKTIKPKSLADKVRRYYHLIYGKAGQPGLYNPATDVPLKLRGKTMRAVLDSEGQPFHKRIKVAFVESVEDPLNPGKLLKPKIKIKGGKVYKSNFDVTQTFYPFNINIRMMEDDDALEEAFTKRINAILAQAPQVRSWVVKCGKRQTANPKSRTGIIPYVLYLLNTYKDNVGEWLTGLVAYEFENTASLQSFLASRDALRFGKSGRKAKKRNTNPKGR